MLPQKKKICTIGIETSLLIKEKLFLKKFFSGNSVWALNVTLKWSTFESIGY